MQSLKKSLHSKLVKCPSMELPNCLCFQPLYQSLAPKGIGMGLAGTRTPDMQPVSCSLNQPSVSTALLSVSTWDPDRRVDPLMMLTNCCSTHESEGLVGAILPLTWRVESWIQLSSCFHCALCGLRQPGQACPG